MNERQMQSRESKVVSSKAFDASLVVTECGGTNSDEHITSSRSGTYITHCGGCSISGTSKWPVPFVRYNWTAQLMSLLMKLNGIMSNLNHICHISVGKVDSNTLLDSTKYVSLGEESLNTRCEQYKDAPEFCEFFEINDLKAQLQAKTTLICNLKNQIKSVKEASNEAKIYKDLCDSIKKTQIQTRDHNDSLIAQVNSKTVENVDLKAQIQEKVFANAALKNKLRKLTGTKVNSHAKVQSLKTRNNNKPVEPKSHTQKPGRQIAIGQRFSLNKSSAVHEKPNTPRSCLRWIPTGRIFKLVGLRWIPTGKMFIDSTTKASLFNDKMTFEQNGSSLVLQSFMTSVHISSGLALQRHMASADNTSGPAAQRKERNDWDSLFFPMFDEYFNPLPSVVHPVPIVLAEEHVVSTGTPSLTTIDQDTLYKNLVLEDSLPVQDVLSRSSDAFSLAVDLKVKLITRRGSEKQQANQGATGKMEWLSFTSWYRISA
ncbi:hypothetical protein Tco_1042083 [Tanacetum coccineum]|uniref:Uncharacterized protein n=1 Tax=Tanacetum coccineum TaxID=301880 RepID=A0ABQ5GI12_9ASTR